MSRRSTRRFYVGLSGYEEVLRDGIQEELFDRSRYLVIHVVKVGSQSPVTSGRLGLVGD